MSETRLTPERRAELEVLTTPHHYTCEDAWYSCPKSEEGCSDDAAGDACNCGAEARAAAMSEALAEVGRLTALASDERRRAERLHDDLLVEKGFVTVLRDDIARLKAKVARLEQEP